MMCRERNSNPESFIEGFMVRYGCVRSLHVFLCANEQVCICSHMLEENPCLPFYKRIEQHVLRPE